MTYDIRTQEELARLRIDIKEKMITGRQPQMTLKRVAKRKREEIMGMVRNCLKVSLAFSDANSFLDLL